MSHKVIALINDGQFEPDNQKIRLQTAVIVRDAAVNPATGFRIDTNVYVNGTETPNQLNAIIVDQIKADLLALGVTGLSDQDILVNKFV
jgi:hypothetical protein